MDEMCCLTFNSWQIFFLENVGLLSCLFFFPPSFFLFCLFFFFLPFPDGTKLEHLISIPYYFSHNRPPCLPTKMPLPHLAWYQPLCQTLQYSAACTLYTP